MKLFTVLAAILFMESVFAQSPEKMSYQAVIRDASDNLVTNQAVGMQISILHGSATDTAVYVETQTPTTNANGLVSIEIGEGTTSNDFATINWADGPYFIKIETDPSADGGTNYTITGISQLLSVPYALHAKTAESVTGTIAEIDPVYVASVASGITATDTTNWNNKLDSYSETQNLSDVISINNTANGQIKNLSDPTDAQDAATKAYVDALINQLSKRGVIIVADADGNIYSIVRIGAQVWMAENLKTTKYNDGTAIPLVTDNTAWENLTTPGYCWYSNDSATYSNTYGALYNWHTVNTGNLCPTGWHVPTDVEWKTLENYLIAQGYNYDGTSSFNKIAKTMASSTGWNSSSSTGAVGNTDYPIYRNKTGFTALPGGNRSSSGTFESVGSISIWWSATEESVTYAWILCVNYNLGDSYSGGYNKKAGTSVRCLRD